MGFKRILGKSGIETSALGMGCWAIGGPFWMEGKPDGYGDVDDKISLRTIKQAVDLGVTFFDTADVYGTGHSERILGEALKKIRDKVVISTKFGYTYNEEIRHITGKYLASEYIRWACDRSLLRLQTDYIDLYTIHVSPIADEQIPEVIGTLDELRKEGRIREYCWSTSNIHCAEQFIKNSSGIALMYTLNVLTSANQMVDLCDRHNLASITIFPLAMGILSGKFTKDSIIADNDVRGSGHTWVKYFKDGKPKIEFLNKLNAVREILTSGGRTPAQGALAWIWGKSPYTIPIPGCKTVEQIIENAAAMDFGPLSNAQVQEIEAILSFD